MRILKMSAHCLPLEEMSDILNQSCSSSSSYLFSFNHPLLSVGYFSKLFLVKLVDAHGLEEMRSSLERYN